MVTLPLELALLPVSTAPQPLSLHPLEPISETEYVATRARRF